MYIPGILTSEIGRVGIHRPILRQRGQLGGRQLKRSARALELTATARTLELTTTTARALGSRALELTPGNLGRLKLTRRLVGRELSR